MSDHTKNLGPQIVTFGCRLNSYESQVMGDHAKEAGLQNAIIVNSCAVTTEATRQARQAVRRLSRENPGAKIIVTGCAAQIDPDQFAAMDEVDHVIGNEEKMHRQTFQEIGQDFGITETERVKVNDIMAVRETAPQMIESFGAKNNLRARAFLQVQNGCDHRCTFCIIPYGRGNSRSVPMGAVIEQIRTLTKNGYKEVVLAGVDMTSYGVDLPGGPNLGSLVQRILTQVPDLPRLRLSSIDAVEVDERLFKLITQEPRVMPHLHLSLQAGDNMILKRMKRRHTRENAIAFCKALKAARPEIVFGADLIAGFPTETEAMFENTLNLIDECDLTWCHVFPYSARPGTPAARMPQLEKAVIKQRAARLRAKAQERLARHLSSHVGHVQKILVEETTRGRLDDFTPVSIAAGPKTVPGTIIKARLTGFHKDALIGQVAA